VSRISSASQLPECRPLVHRDVIGLIALDLVLWLILGCMNSVTLEGDLGCNHSDDPPTDRPASEFQRLKRCLRIGFSFMRAW
jgi:hypothetical protein